MKQAAGHKNGWVALAMLSAVSFFVTAVFAAPASLYAAFLNFENNDVAYTNINGTLWKGSVKRLTLSDVPMGEVHFRLSPLSLLSLAPRLNLSAQDGAVLGRGVVTIGLGSRLSLSDVTVRIDLNATAKSGVLGQPAQGFAEVAIDKFTFSRKNGCKEASGTVWTDVLDAPARRYNLPELPLEGPLRCDEGAVVVQLAGENDRAGADLMVRVLPNLTYEVTAVARPAQEDVASALKVFGFEDDNGKLTYGAAGVFRSAGS